MNKYANFYIETTLSQLDAQYKIVNEQLEEIYKKYSKDHDILIQELSRIMMDFNIKGEFMDLDNKTQVKINKDMQGKIKNMIDNEKSGETESINNILRDAAANTYNYQDYILSLGLDFTSLPLTEKQITKIVNNKIMGKNWIEREGINKKALETQLRKDIDDFVKGKTSVNKIGKNMRDNFQLSKYNSNRLARTELCRVQQEVLNVFDEEHDVEWQLFMGTLDNKTSRTCRDFDGEQYKITDNKRPIPPLHPHCRSAMVGIPHKDYKPTTRRDNETGDIIDYKNYNEWSGKPQTSDNIKINNSKDLNEYGYNKLNKYGIKKVDMKNNNLEVGKVWIDELENLMKEYNSPVVEFSAENLKIGVAGKVSRLPGDENCILFMKETKSDIERFTSQFDRLVNNGATTVIDFDRKEFIKSTLVHEFAHTMVGIDANLDKNITKEVKKLFASYKKEIKSIDKRVIVDKTLTFEEGEYLKKALIISEYSLTNVDEFVAEGFVQAKMGTTKNKYAEEIFKIINKNFKK